MARTPRPEHEIEHRRSHILDAAGRVFAARGFEAASIEDIAREAGYGASTLYGYFKGKQAIVSGIIERFLDDQERAYDLVLPPGLTLRQSLELLLRRQLGFLENSRAAMVFMVQRGLPLLDDHEALAAREEALRDMLAPWLEQHAAPGDLGTQDAGKASRRLSGLVMGELFHWIRDDEGLPLADRVPEILDFFFHGIAGPPASGAQHVSRP